MDAKVIADGDFDIASDHGEHDLVIEVSVAMKNHHERFYKGDICGERWIRIDLAEQANAYQSVFENLLSFFSRAKLDVAVNGPQLKLSRKLLVSSRRRLAEAGIDGGRDLVVSIQPGAGRNFKRWPAERFGKLCNRIREELNAKIVLLGGLNEDDLIDAVLDEEPNCELVLRQLPALELAGVIASSTLFLGNDSGFTHVASACDVPTIGLYGPTAPSKWAPVHPLFELVAAKDSEGKRQTDMRFISIGQVVEAVEKLLKKSMTRWPSDGALKFIVNPTLRSTSTTWSTSDVRIDVSGESLEKIVDRCRKPCSFQDLENDFKEDLVDFVLSTGVIVPVWAKALIEKAVSFAESKGGTGRSEKFLTQHPLCAYVIESGFQHVFPVLAMLDVLPGPVFTTGTRVADRLSKKAEVIQVEEKHLAMALSEHGIDVILSTSQRIAPDMLRASSRRKIVFIGHGDSDKSYGQGPKPKPSFVHHKINRSFDLLTVASHFHMARYNTQSSVLTGYLKHDLFLKQKYSSRPKNPGWVLWAPSWGRHSSVDAWLEQVVESTGNLGLKCVLHFHPYSYEREAHLVQRAQALVIRHSHFTIAHCLNILDAMAPCELMLGDVSTTCYDWLMFDRPIVFLDHEGLLIEAEKDLFEVGLHVHPDENLEEAIRIAKSSPDQLASKRRQALESRFFKLDGKASERVRDAIYQKWIDDWQWH